MKMKLFLFSLVMSATLKAANGVPNFDHIVVVIEENHSLHDCLDNPDMPYFNFLAKNGALFSRSYCWGHPSQPNYLTLFSGSNHNIDDNDYHSKINAPNLWTVLNAVGKKYISYSEDLPEIGSDVEDNGDYARKHNPTPQFVNVPDEANQTFEEWPTDYTTLPQVSFVVPNEENDAHDGTLEQADNWLQKNISEYAAWAKDHNSLLIVTFDENIGDEEEIPTLCYGAHVKPGVYSTKINHYSILRLLEDAFNTSYAGNSATATTITDIWTTEPNPTPNPEYTLNAASARHGEVNISFVTKNWNSKSVSINYSINGGSTKSADMKNDTNNWTYRITNVPDQATIQYSVKFEWGGEIKQTDQKSMTYVNPSPTDLFIQSIAMIDPTIARVTFKPTFTAQSVQIHYTVNGGRQQNAQMNNKDNIWTIKLERLENNDKVQYTFTYEQNGVKYNTNWFSYTVNTNPQPSNFNYIQGIQTVNLSSATQINFKSSKPLESVTLTYSINGASDQIIAMKSQGGNIWSANINDLKSGDQIKYSFTYIRNQLTTTSPTITYVK